MTVWLKTAHIAGLALWCSGLLALPGLFARRGRAVEDADRFDLQKLARILFIGIASPAAFVTVASGTALIFLRPVLEPWFAVKLLLVAALAGIHVWTGLVVLRVFQPDGRYARWRAPVGVLGTSAVAAAILWLVLDKPPIDMDRVVSADLMEPGRLGEIIRAAYRRLRS